MAFWRTGQETTHCVTDDKRVVESGQGVVVAEIVAVAVRVAGWLIDQPVLQQTIDQRSPVSLYVVVIVLESVGYPADADVQVAVCFGYVPGIAGEPLSEKPQMAVRILPAIGVFQFQRDQLQCFVSRRAVAKQASEHTTGNGIRSRITATASSYF